MSSENKSELMDGSPEEPDAETRSSSSPSSAAVTKTGGVADPQPRMWRPSTRQIMNVVGPFIGLLVVIGLFSLNSEVRQILLTGGNLKLILTQTVIVALGAMGMTLIIVSGGIDLSAGSVVALTGVVCATLILHEWPPVLAIAFSILAGGAVGFVNGSIIVGFRMMPFIVTLGMMGIARGVAKSKWLADNQVVNVPESVVSNIMVREKPFDFLPLPPGVWLTIALAVIMTCVMRYTVFGRYAFAIGSNEATARLCGIRVRTHKVLIYVIAGMFFGLAGLMQFSRLSQGDPSVAIGLELEIIAAVVIGGASLSGGTGSILGSMIGALIMGFLKNGSSLMNWPTYGQEIIIGIVIVIAVGLDRLRSTGDRAG